MKRFQSETPDGGKAKIAVVLLTFFLALAASGVAQSYGMTALPAIAAASPNPQPPKDVKVLAQVPLPGLPVTRMYTQWEFGRTYLYIEHGGQKLTTVDVTKKKHPQVVTHEPAKVEPARYAELAEGGTIAISLPWQVNLGIDNIGGRGALSVLDSTNHSDLALLQAFGHGTSNLAVRDRGLIFFASPAQLLIVEDRRWSGTD